MKSRIQFHGLLDEIVEFANDVASEYSLCAVLIFEEIKNGTLVKENLTSADIENRGDKRTVNRVLLVKSSEAKSLDLSIKALLKPNASVVSITIGAHAPEGLHESSLSSMCDDEVSIAIAKKVATKIKKITESGAIAVSLDNVEQSNARTHRYTSGAKKLYEQGVKILPVLGNYTFKLEKLQ